MSHNKEIEKKIGVADALIREMENHRDQAKLFQAAAEALKEMNKQIADLDGKFVELSSVAIHDRFVALEAQSREVAEKVEGDRQDLNRNLQEHGLKISGIEDRQLEYIKRSQSDSENLSREIEKSRDSSCAFITSGKDPTIEFIKGENAQIKELIYEQCKRTQKWSIILLLVGLCSSAIGGAVLYFLLNFK